LLAQIEVASERVPIPEGVDVFVEGKHVRVEGPLGVLERDFSHASVDIRRDSGELLVEAVWPDKRRRALVGTIRSHVKNMITGVTKGFTYKLKVVSAHFPMTIRVEKDRVVIENFSGERKPRVAKILGGVRVEIENEDVIVKGIDIQNVSQTAANIQNATRIKKKDPRVFLDGIYVFEKGEGM